VPACLPGWLQENGSVLDAFLYDMQLASAQIIVAHSSTATNAADLEAMPLPQRAMQPQLPYIIHAQPDYQAQALAAFTSLFSCLEATIGLLLLALGAHFGMAMLVDGSTSVVQRGRVQPRAGPLAIQFPYLSWVILLVAMPPILFWCGRLLALRQASWAALLVLLCSGMGSLAVYLWIVQHILSTTETAVSTAYEQAVVRVQPSCRAMTLSDTEVQPMGHCCHHRLTIALQSLHAAWHQAFADTLW
jgi:hypothetical protein